MKMILTDATNAAEYLACFSGETVIALAREAARLNAIETQESLDDAGGAQETGGSKVPPNP